MKLSTPCYCLILLPFFCGAAAVGAPPANDNFTGAQTLSGTSWKVVGTTKEATREAIERKETRNNTVWYRWNPSVAGRVRIAVTPSGTTPITAPYFVVWTGKTLSDLTMVGFSGSTPASRPIYLDDLPVKEGTPLYVSVGCNSLSRTYQGTFTISLVQNSQGDVRRGSLTAVSVKNVRFSNATMLSGGRSVALSYGLEAPKREAGEPSRNPNYSSWWRWTAPANGTMNLSLVGSELGRHYEHFRRKTLLAYRVSSFVGMASSAPILYASVSQGLPPDSAIPVSTGDRVYICAGSGGLRSNSNFSGGESNAFPWKLLTITFSSATPKRGGKPTAMSVYGAVFETYERKLHRSRLTGESPAVSRIENRIRRTRRLLEGIGG